MDLRDRRFWVFGIGASLLGLGCAMEGDVTSEDLGESQAAAVNAGGSTGTVGGSSSVSVSFSNGASYFGTRDTYISSTSPSTEFGLTTGCSVAGGEVAKSCLMKWDLSSIPSNAIVESAWVRFRVTDASTSTFDIHQVNAAWDELDANWTQRTSAANWSSPGCNSIVSDRTSAPVATIPGTLGFQTYDLNGLGRAMIQNWLVNPSANKGFIIRSSTGSLDAISIRSAQAPLNDRPSLGVAYHLP